MTTPAASAPQGNVRVLLRPHVAGGLSGGLYRGQEVICDVYMPVTVDNPDRTWDERLLRLGLPRVGSWSLDDDGVSWTALVAPALPRCSWCRGTAAVLYDTAGTPPATRYACAACCHQLGEHATCIAEDLLPPATADPDVDLSTTAGRHIIALYRAVRGIERWDGSWNGGDAVALLGAWLTRLGLDTSAPGWRTDA